MDLKIIQINIRSLTANRNSLEFLLEKEKIDIVMLTETWLKKGQSFNISGYNLIAINRQDGYGGVAILAKKNIFTEMINIQINLEPIEAILVKTKLKNTFYYFCSIYIPPKTASNSIKIKFDQLIDKLSTYKNIIFGGDFNARHPLWDNSNISNNRGTLIANKIISTNFITLNNGDWTRQNISSKSNSAIDITCASTDIINQIDWKVIMDNIGSDHLPILIQLSTGIDTDNIKRTHIKFKKLAEYIQTVEFDDIDNIEELEKQIQNIILNFTVSTNSKHTNKPWWSEKLKKLWIIKQEKQKIYNRNKTIYTAKELKDIIKIFKKEIKINKQVAWNKFAAEINPDTTIKDIYRKINIFNNKRKKNQTSFIDSKNKFDELLKLNYTQIDYSLVQIEKQVNTDIFHYEEVYEVIHNNKNSAGGINNITNKILKLLNINQIEKITELLNKMWNTQQYPASWKLIKGIVIPKPNKIETDLNNYRIISLLNVFQKLFSKLIKKILNEQIQNRKLLPEDSYGFRSGVGTNEYFARLVQIIENNKKQNFSSVIITIDITKAFDKVNSNILLNKLRELGFENKYIFWIMESIRYRKILIGEKNNKTEKIISEGVPQGDVLSPLLFNLYSLGIHELKNEYTEVLQFADDFTLIVSDSNCTDLNFKTNLVMRKAKNILEELKFTINVNKCKYMCVNVSPFYMFTVYLSDKIVKQEDNLRILGITFDNKFNFRKNNNENKEKVLKQMNVLKIFGNKRGGAHPKSMLNVHNALIRSRTTYASVCSIPEDKQIIAKLQTLHNTALRHCLGVAKSTPIVAILGEAAEWPVELIAKFQNIKFIAKHIANNSNIGKDIKSNQSTFYLNKLYSEFPILKYIPVINRNKLNQQNLNICCDIFNYKKNLTILEKRYLALDRINQLSDSCMIYTDGSKDNEGVGIGIFLEDTKEKLQFFSDLQISIKCTEMIAIFLAIHLTLKMGKKNITILTDSKSSCTSLANHVLNKHCKTDKYFENKIINLANIHTNTNITVQWIPAHVGIIGNEIADSLAGEKHKKKQANTYNQIILPKEEILTICKLDIHNKWIEKYKNITLTKGKFYANIMPEPMLKPWFRKTTTLDSTQLKQIIRLRSGHSYDKKFKKLMNISDTNLCNTCNELENAEHIIEQCTQYTHIRNKYAKTIQKGFSNILKNKNTADMIAITEFLNEIKYNL